MSGGRGPQRAGRGVAFSETPWDQTATASQLRIKRRQTAEAKAQQTPVKIVFPLILCILPALFVIIIGPGAIRIMNNLFQ